MKGVDEKEGWDVLVLIHKIHKIIKNDVKEKKFMKRTIYTTMAALMGVVTVIGATSVNVMADEKVTLTIWGDPDNQAVIESTFDAINEAFEEAHPNIEIDYQWSGSFDNLNVATQSDSLPDLFWVQGNKSTKMAELARNGYILNLDEYNMDASRYPQSCVDYATVDGSIYCSYPAFIDYCLFYYNKEMFEENGWGVPNTWSEFEALVQTIADAGIQPIAMGGAGDWDRYWLMQNAAPAFCNDTLLAIKNGEEDIDWSGMEKLFDMFRRFSENGYMGSDFQATDGVGAQLTFTNGKAAISIDGTWSNSIYRDLDFEVGAFAAPSEEGVSYAQSGESNFLTYAISSKCEHPDEAVEYLKFLNTKESEQILEDNAGSIPVTGDIEPKDEMVEQFAAFDEVGQNIYHVLSGIATDTASPQDVFLSSVTPKLMTGEITGAEGVAMIQAEIARAEE